MEPTYDPRASAPPCRDCGGNGWLIVRRNGGEFAKRCRCAQRARRARLFETVRIPSRHAACSFETFDCTGDRTGKLRDALDRARRFAEAYPIVERGLVFMGPAGVGKTHLAVAVLRTLVLDKGTPCLFTDYNDLLKRIQDTYGPESGATEMEILQPVLQTEVVLLDDLGGARSPSLWTLDVLFHVLNTRYNEKRTTLVTTNFLDEQGRLDQPAHSPEARDTLTSRIGTRLRSRLYEMCDTVVLDGPDWRRQAGAGPR